MITEKSKCEKDFIERLIKGTDEAYKLSDFFKRSAYSNNNLFTDKDVVIFVESKVNLQDRLDSIKSFINKNHNIDVIKK